MFACEKCAGTGRTRWGKCYTCHGKGGWKTSPEARAKKRERTLQEKMSEKAGNQSWNRDQSLYLHVMDRNRMDRIFVQMRMDHDAGRAWTPAQLMSARQKLAGERETRKLLGGRA